MPLANQPCQRAKYCIYLDGSTHFGAISLSYLCLITLFFSKTSSFSLAKSKQTMKKWHFFRKTGFSSTKT